MIVMEWLKSLEIDQYLRVKRMIEEGKFDLTNDKKEYVYGYEVPCTLVRGTGDMEEIINYNDWLESEVAPV